MTEAEKKRVVELEARLAEVERENAELKAQRDRARAETQALRHDLESTKKQLGSTEFARRKAFAMLLEECRKSSRQTKKPPRPKGLVTCEYDAEFISQEAA